MYRYIICGRHMNSLGVMQCTLCTNIESMSSIPMKLAWCPEGTGSTDIIIMQLGFYEMVPVSTR